MSLYATAGAWAQACARNSPAWALLYFLATYSPHQEGWRDWPVETPATPSDLVRGRCQLQQVSCFERPGRCGKSAPSRNLRPHQPRRRFVRRGAQMAVESLRCRECGETYPLEARYVCEQC